MNEYINNILGITEDKTEYRVQNTSLKRSDYHNFLNPTCKIVKV